MRKPNGKTGVPKGVLSNMGIQTTRQYKEVKRYELKAVIDAVDVLQFGSAFMPGCYYSCENEIAEINRHLRSLKKKLSVKEWGR